MVDMNKLSTLTVTSLIMAISFTVLAVAGIFYTFYRKGNLKHPVAKVICLFALPFTAFAMWILAGLSLSKTFANNEALAILLSIVISFAILTIIYFVSKYIEESNRKKEFSQKLNNQKKNDVVEQIADVEEDLNNLKKIIDEVIEVKPEENTKKLIEENPEEKVEEVKQEPKESNIVIIEKPEQKPEEVKEDKTEKKSEEVKEEEKIEQPEIEIKTQKIVIEKKQRQTRKKVTQEEVKEDKPEEKNEQIEEALKVEDTAEEKIEDDESDFIKSLSKILEELENNKNNEE